MTMLKDFYVTFEVIDSDTGEYFSSGGQNIAAYDRNDAIRQVEEQFGKFGTLVVQEVEQISEDEV